MKKKLKRIIAIVICISAIIGAPVLAGTYYTAYNTTVARVNGSGYTGYQTKANSGENGYLKSTLVGGKYTVDARMQDSTSRVHGPWVRKVTDNKEYVLYSNANHKKGNDMRVQFSNDLTTLVSVQVTGSWRSN